MANEITATVQLSLSTTNNHRELFNPPPLQLTQNNAGTFHNTVALTTVDTKLSIINLTTYGYGYLQNVSVSTSVVISIGVDSTNVIRPFGRLKPKEFALLRFNTSSTYRAQCESSSGKLLIGVWED